MLSWSLSCYRSTAVYRKFNAATKGRSISPSWTPSSPPGCHSSRCCQAVWLATTAISSPTRPPQAVHRRSSLADCVEPPSACTLGSRMRPLPQQVHTSRPTVPCVVLLTLNYIGYNFYLIFSSPFAFFSVHKL